MNALDAQAERYEERIANLRQINEDLRAALEPFAAAAQRYNDVDGVVTMPSVQLWQDGRRIDFITVGDLRRARAALRGL